MTEHASLQYPSRVCHMSSSSTAGMIQSTHLKTCKSKDAPTSRQESRADSTSLSSNSVRPQLEVC